MLHRQAYLLSLCAVSHYDFVPQYGLRQFCPEYGHNLYSWNQPVNSSCLCHHGLAGGEVRARHCGERLTDGIIRAKHSEEAYFADQLQILLNRVDQLKDGAFSPLTQQPLVRAFLFPMSSAGWVALVQNGMLPGL